MLNSQSRSVRIALAYLFVNVSMVFSQDLPDSLPELPFHLTARPWKSLQIPREQYLDVIEGICRVAQRHQSKQGAIVDPYLKREHQYSTPYYAFAVGTLLHAGRAKDLQESGIRAMDHATTSFAGGSSAIPDAHGEFFIAPLAGALELYDGQVPADVMANWRLRLKTPLSSVLASFTGHLNNWRTYAMKGEWARVRAGLVGKTDAQAFIETSWTQATQRERIASDKWSLYQDWSSDPQSHAVEAVGRGNLIGLVAEGYDGPSAKHIWSAVRRGTHTSMLLQDPSGQCPPNGRTDDHIFNDVLYALCFEAMAEDANKRGETGLAGQYRRAAMLGLKSILRWQRKDAPWEGSFYITKNRLDPARRIGYQPASQWGNYNGAVMLHLAEAYLARQSQIPESPAPVEIGGYAFRTDAAFSTFVANAGGMQVFCNLRGATIPKYGKSWTPLGIVRFGRVQWDTRLGPSDGEQNYLVGKEVRYQTAAMKFPHDYRAGSGVSFAPTWKERGEWVRMVDMHQHYQATPHIDFVHPLLVRFRLVYHNATGRGGPYFVQEFVVTPDGVLTTLKSPSDVEYGVTLPLLENDGTPLNVNVGSSIATTSYGEGTDEQCFLCLDADVQLQSQPDSHLSSYGYLRPVRVTAAGKQRTVFVYPRNNSDPTAETVRDSFRLTATGYSTSLHRVDGTLFVGRHSAGGEGQAIELNGDGVDDISFDVPCQFVLQLDELGKPYVIEVDRMVTMSYGNLTISVSPFEPTPIRSSSTALPR